MAFMPSLTREARKTLNEMYENDELTDITVKGEDSQIGHRIHAIVLASVSSKFKERVRPGSHDGEVRFPFPEQVLKAIIGIAYHGRIEDEFLSRWLEDALHVSLKFEVKELQDAVSDYLKRKISVDNMLHFWKLAKQLSKNVENLNILNCVVKFISRNVEILSHDEILSLPILAFKEILGCDHLNMTRNRAEKLVRSYIEANRITRGAQSSLKSLAKIPTKNRIPKVVILAVGGWEKDAPTGSSEVYNALTEVWKPVSLQLPLGTITYHRLEFIKMKLYLIGGYIKHEGTEGFLDTLYQYDTTKKSWDKKASMSVSRCYVSTVTLDGKIFAMGGRTSNQPGRLSTVEVYNPELNLWSNVAEMSVARSDFSSVVFEDQIYAIGGFDGFNYLSSVERYNPKTDSWVIVGNLATPRQGSSSIVCRNKIYVLGGFDGGERLRSVECFNTQWNGTLQWHEVPNMITCRSNFAACVMENNQDIMVIGGFKEDVNAGLRKVCKDVEILNTERNVWRPGPKLSEAKSALACIKLDNQHSGFK